jgi:hypothetical protein
MSSNITSGGNDQLQSLLDTVERLRLEKFPHLDAAMVRDLLRLHADGRTADADISRNAEQLVEKQLRQEA